MDIYICILLLILLLNAVMVVCVRKLLTACVIFMIQSLVMVLIWIFLQAPDLAVTEAAVGTGVSSLLFFLALRRIRALESTDSPAEDAAVSVPSSAASSGKGGASHG